MSSLLVKRAGEIKLTGDTHDTYGTAIASACSLLDRILTELRVEDLCIGARTGPNTESNISNAGPNASHLLASDREG